MKYIKEYRLFVENIEIESSDSESISNIKEKLNDLKKEISEFEQRKGNLEKTIFDNVENKDISGVIENIIGDNRFLSMYLPIAKKMDSLEKTSKRIDYYNQLKSEREGNLKLTSNLSDPEEKRDQTDKLKTQIKDIDDKRKEMEDKLKETSKTIEDEKESLKIYIDDMKKKLEDDIKELKININVNV